MIEGAVRQLPSEVRRRLIAALGGGLAMLVGRDRAASASASAGASTAVTAAAGGAERAQVSSPEGEPQALLDDLVTAYHILFHQGLVDAFGHVTVRDPSRPTHYFMARSIQPPFVTREDIVELDADSHPVKGDPHMPFERFIHGEIYRRRPDVNAVVHSHAIAVLPFSAVKSTPLRAICHTAGFIGSGAPVFEIRDFVGDSSNMLVANATLGAALAKSLGGSRLVLMRGHGFTTVGGSVREAVYNAINTVRNARIQAEAMSLGPVTYLTPGEATAVSRLHDAALDAGWQVWARQAAGQLPCACG
ncbi:MAG: class II aldolase/adducin family protein [Acetobacteraceae bacterium]